MGKKKGNNSATLIAAFIWIIIIVIVAFLYKYLVKPYKEKKLVSVTGSQSIYKKKIKIAADSFSGYSIFRSKELSKLQKRRGIKIEIEDDGANYDKRIRNLKSGKVQMALFTIDSYISAGAKLGEFPGSIVMIVDETNGADAILVPNNGYNSIQDLNNKKTHIILTPNSPSEFLARVVLTHFNLPLLPKDWKIAADGAKDVYERLCNNPDKNDCYVLWEPYVSKAIINKKGKILLSSSKLLGYIVDILVVERSFLQKNKKDVENFMKDYFTVSYRLNKKDEMKRLIIKDGEKSGVTISDIEAENLVKGIIWKNTYENYGHFGILKNSNSLPYIEDMIGNIIDVLVNSGAINEDPLQGKVNTIFYKKILEDLKKSKFHPDHGLSILDGNGEDISKIREKQKAVKLSEDEWKKLIPVGEMKVKSITFRRGGSTINFSGKRELNKLIKKLKAWPDYYLIVIGHARNDGDMEANLKLSKARAEAVTKFLKNNGISKDRVKSLGAKPIGNGGEYQSVSFELVQMPY